MANLKISNFEGLYGDLEGKYSSEYIFLEHIATRSQIFDWNIKPHVHPNLFQVFILKKGKLSFLDSFSNRALQAPCLIFIPPTFLHGLVYSPEVDGQILSISDIIIEDIFKTSSNFLESCNQIQVIEEFDKESSFEKILLLLNDIENEIFNDQKERNIMLKSCLTQFFISLYRLFAQDFKENIDSPTANYFRKFQNAIKTSNRLMSIPEYANQLNISAVHLNRICNAVSGKSAGELIHQNTINEAQKYLLHTSYSISEIAYLLHFEYPNYFAKMFKKYVGLTPNEFRRKDRI